MDCRQTTFRTFAPLLIGCSALAAGCVVKESTAPPKGMLIGPGSKARASTATPVAERLNKPSGVSQSVRVNAGVAPLGIVPYDNLSLPLVSPDGAFIATQTGSPPEWPTVLAEPAADSDAPSADSGFSTASALNTGVEVYRISGPGQIEHAFTIDERVLLGRSCDGEGFLVESPREDGSRWIGKALWSTGQVVWLVDGPHVNAFAALGPGGRLAWSRRAVDSHHFDLVVRDGAGQWTIESRGDDWLMPTWTGSGAALFALNLNEKLLLQARYGSAAGPTAFRQTTQRVDIARNADLYSAYEALAGHGSAVETAPRQEQLLLFHPTLGRMVLWRPLSLTQKKALLPAGSLAAVSDGDDFVLAATSASLLRMSLSNPEIQIDLKTGLHIPRATTSAEWPYILLSPGDGQVGVMGLRLLPADEPPVINRR